MNKYSILIISACIIQTSLICGCAPAGEDEPQKTEPEKTLSASPLALSFKAEGESKTIMVTSNTDWTLTHATQTEAWCIPNRTSGTGNGSIQITASRNFTEEEKTDSYILAIEGKELTINLTQEKADLRVPLKFSSTNEDFIEGDAIGLFVANRPTGSGTPIQMNSLTENQVNNIKIIKQVGSLWSVPENVFWKNPTTKADAYAYYPWRQSTSEDNPSNWQVAVEKDQSNESKYLLSGRSKYGQALNLLPDGEGTLHISFKPVVSKISIEIQLLNEAQQAYQIIKSQILSVYTAGNLNLNTGQMQEKGLKSPLNTMLTQDNAGSLTSQAYLIPQTCEMGDFLTITYLDKRYNEIFEIPVRIDTTLLFEAGKSYQYVIRLEKTIDRLTLGNVSISGWDKGDNIEFPFN